MLLFGRPSPERVAAYRSGRVDATPTCMPASEPPAGFRRDSYQRVVGHGTASFARARDGLVRWAAHRGGGVEVFPIDVALEPGAVVALVTRQAGVWVLAACGVETVVDEPSRFGFTYAILPGHPERGYESFTVALDEGVVTFTIEAVSRPGTALIRLGGAGGPRTPTSCLGRVPRRHGAVGARWCVTGATMSGRRLRAHPRPSECRSRRRHGPSSSLGQAPRRRCAVRRGESGRRWGGR